MGKNTNDLIILDEPKNDKKILEDRDSLSPVLQAFDNALRNGNFYTKGIETPLQGLSCEKEFPSDLHKTLIGSIRSQLIAGAIFANPKERRDTLIDDLLSPEGLPEPLMKHIATLHNVNKVSLSPAAKEYLADLLRGIKFEDA